ncbi:hypothetical protein [Melittangium boletus]|uniref:Uncharacterized protein n=1 Tax=Melittangium boletus DSM 14713 TaxID=1294270 RepID=A0A250I7Y6_9BACT|nr:hypothetical protein [Melittangium boletus]ATB27885.1 hypothetical protein MEBOL_001330 [Melittangium boletus DSM 14713]
MQITTWFIAKEDEADAIASTVTTEEHDLEEWPNIELPLIEMELMALFATLRGSDDLTVTSSQGEPFVFDEDEGLLVIRVSDDFIQALARISSGKEADIVETWAENMDSELDPEELRELLADMAEFAREAVKKRVPVLSLSTF